MRRRRRLPRRSLRLATAALLILLTLALVATGLRRFLAFISRGAGVIRGGV